ncbi:MULTISPECIES: hypothetical protein [Enterobacterales]
MAPANAVSCPVSVSWEWMEFHDDLDATIQQVDADMYRMKQARQDATLTR